MVYTMTVKAKLFMNGRSQAVRLPAQFRFKGTEVYVRRDEGTGDVILSEHKPALKDWAEFFKLRDAALEEAKGFLEDREQPPLEERDLF